MATVISRCPVSRSRQHRKAGSVIGSVAVGVFVIAALALVLALTVVPLLGGGYTLTVLTGSMRPAIPAGSVVVVRPVAPAAIKIGDVITYAAVDPVSGRSELVTHRVAERRVDGELITKGDANRVPDSAPVKESQVRGEVWYHIPLVGTLREQLVSPAGAGYAGAAVLLIAGWIVLRRMRKPAGHDTVEEDR